MTCMQEHAGDPLTTADRQPLMRPRRPSLRRTAALVAVVLLVAIAAGVLFGEQRGDLGRLQRQVAALKRQLAEQRAAQDKLASQVAGLN